MRVEALLCTHPCCTDPAIAVREIHGRLLVRALVSRPSLFTLINSRATYWAMPHFSTPPIVSSLSPTVSSLLKL